MDTHPSGRTLRGRPLCFLAFSFFTAKFDWRRRPLPQAFATVQGADLFSNGAWEGWKLENETEDIGMARRIGYVTSLLSFPDGTRFANKVSGMACGSHNDSSEELPFSEGGNPEADAIDVVATGKHNGWRAWAATDA